MMSIAVALHADPHTTHVGVPTKIEQLVLPGSELEVKPLDDRKLPVVLRIVNVDQHGTAHRYDFVYYTLDPGTFDLREYLRRKDGTPLGDVPEIKVTATTLLPPGQVLPHEPAAGRPAFTGGYWLAVIAAGGLWVLGLLAILFVGRKKKQEATATAGGGDTLADRLRPLVERGLAGQLDLVQRADLERSLLAFWTKKLKLDALKPAERFAKLRADADAGPLLNQLETWLHKPGPQSGVDVSVLLRPYQNLPADVLDPVPEVAVT
jgi:hypothetical protein